MTLGEGEEKVLEVAAGPLVPSEPQAVANRPAGATQRMAGLVTGGVGVGAVVLGTAFGLVSKSTYDGAVAACQGVTRPCQGAGAHDGQVAHDQAAISTVGFIAAAALLGGGAALYFTAPKGRTAELAPAVGTNEAGLVLRGVW